MASSPIILGINFANTALAATAISAATRQLLQSWILPLNLQQAFLSSVEAINVQFNELLQQIGQAGALPQAIIFTSESNAIIGVGSDGKATTPLLPATRIRECIGINQVECFTTLPDYFAAQLTQTFPDCITLSVAQSLGYFDAHSQAWEITRIEAEGMASSKFPSILPERTAIGQIGQCAVLGAIHISRLAEIADETTNTHESIAKRAALSLLLP